ncbi:MAG: hypothetical protein JWM05_1543 [Acidimicrobiales bacterium]|nr:hypothetical protein [Acidimicrobiales bacterium]
MRRIAIALAAVTLVAACSSGEKAGPKTTGPATPAAAGGTTAPVRTQPPGTGTCDPTDPAACLLPWPNNHFTRADSTSATGLRLDLPRAGMPANAGGVHIQPAEWNRNDGFSPASTLMTRVPDLDVRASHLPPVSDIGRSLDPGSSLVLLDLDTGRRVAAWAELDANAKRPSKQLLLITPATSLIEGHRHVVALRNLKHRDGTDVRPTKAFAALVAHPRPQDEPWLHGLATHGVPLAKVDIAWSFTVGSAQSISGRLRGMWQEVSAALGDGAPKFAVTSSQLDGAARVVAGTFQMPRYLQGDGGPGSFLNNAGDPDGRPKRNGTMTASFLCTLPAPANHAPSPTVLYGHGLLGDRTEVLGLGKVAAAVNITFCALDWLGMSASDIPTVAASFKDLSAFRSLPDRLQQGDLGFLLLGRLLRSAQGFVTNPAFRTQDHKPAIDIHETSFLGASQGGILGAVPSALTNDWQRVVLAVPGIGYNLLLRRSVDFDPFVPQIQAAYPDQLDQALLLDLLEQLWQRGENAGYAQHLTRQPYPGVTAKTVMLLEAFGDHQVANVSTEKLARTLGLGRRAPTLAAGRSTDVSPFWGIPAIASLPSRGSGLVVWDFDTPAPPLTNTPNRRGDDPHGKLASVPEALALVSEFIKTNGRLIDVCAGKPCHTPG